jgi:hypothetical protein
MVFGSKIDAANLTLTNKGGCSAKDVVILASADSGVELKEPDKKPFSLNTNMPMPLTMPFSLNKARRGVYRLFFQASCQGAAKQDCACFMRAVKIGLLSTDANKVYADPLRAWMTEKGYVWDEVHDADDLRGTLFKYDLLVLAPELYLPDKWVHNLSSFVKNSQSLLVIDKVTTNQEQKMAELLGYSELKFEPFRSEVGQLKISGDTLGAGIGFVPSETFPLQGCWGNKCTSRVVTGKPLAEYTYTEKSGTPSSILAIAANIYGKGRVVHLNFHAEQTANQLENILEKTLNWLLCTDALPYSPEP